jgi:hypothetical protein
MQRVEPGSAMTAMFADHGATVSTFTSASRFSSSTVSPILAVLVSIISLSSIITLLSLLVLTSPAVSLVSGGAGLTKIDTGKTLGG